MAICRLVFACFLLTVLTSNAAPVPKNIPGPKNGPVGIKFVPLPKGTFYMGWNGTEGSAKKTEIQEDFEIAIHTVTQAQWQDVMGKNPSFFSRNGAWKSAVEGMKDDDLKQFPVEGVSWDDCQDFLKKLNEKENGNGWLYRLPSSAEWEYACRGGATSVEDCSYHFYFAKPTNDLSSKEANINGQFPMGDGEKGPYLERPTKVGSYSPNSLGLFDMHGNVWQWCSDACGVGGRPPALINPPRVTRGGSYTCNGSGCMAASRSPGLPDVRFSSRGVRVVRIPLVSENK